MAETDPLLATVITIGLAVPAGVAAQEATRDAPTPPLATPSANVTIVATGLSFSTAMAFGPDGKRYVANHGFLYPPGAGDIVTVDVETSAGA